MPEFEEAAELKIPVRRNCSRLVAYLYIVPLVLDAIGSNVATDAVVARWGCALFTASLATLAINTIRILSHYFSPHLKPLAASKKPLYDCH
jgi:hypothetical protein